MDSRFAHLYKRDSSVSMIRVKMSRRRSQSQKVNREKIQNLRRHLDHLPEIELSMDASSLMATQDKSPKTKAANDVNAAAEERKKMLARYKENKMLQKEKEKRVKEKKGVFKVGLYKPQPLGYLPLNTAAQSRAKITETNQSTRVTRSMMQNQKPAAERHAVPKKVENALTTRASAKTNSKSVTTTKTRAATVEPSLRAPTTRSAAKTSAAVVKPVTDSRTAKSRSTVKCSVAPSPGKEKDVQGNTKAFIEKKTAKKKDTAVDSWRPEEEEPKAAAPSFAPQGFVFQPPVGLRSFEPAPLSPHSASAFFSPSFLSDGNVEPTFPSPPKPVLPAPSLSSPPPLLSTPPPDHPANPPSVSSPPPPSSSSTAPSPPLALLEPQHDVAYFREVMASETEHLTGLSELWESRFDDASIPEETRDQMRTAVGQARLLMKERFGQFSRLVDDCDLGRGEKITTCTDLQGFWDMVYFQVEDVNKKFNALKEAEAREWKEEVRPLARKRVAKKPPVVGGKAGTGACAAAKSRLAAVKAAMRAKQAEQKATETSDNIQEDSSSVPAAPAITLPSQTVVFNGGFFQVESPVKPSGAVRRSCRTSAVSSPCVSKFSTPGRQCRSTTVSHASPLPSLSATPLPIHQHELLPAFTPLRSAEALPQSPRAPQISPDHNQNVSPDTDTRSQSHINFDLSSSSTQHTQPDTSNGPENSPVAQTHDSPSLCELPVDSSEPQHEENIPESMFSPSSQEEPQENISCEVSEESLHVQPGADAGLDTQSQGSSHSSSEPVEAEPSVCAPASPTLMPSTPTNVLRVSTALCNEVINGSPTSMDVEMTENQDAECLDIERYLQPTVRYSMSLAQSPAAERFSFGAVDAEMESPVTQAEERPNDVLATPTAFPRMVFSPQISQMSENLLLIFPERKEKVRQSVCERDLITFTPPTYK
ncbi:disks large-associated protein 5-like isoform X3 [Carassius carassius]|uniref:disks large-associated protein 5-like isoform X3 n=1 Tax=Carassius carassius TaxID=217509 RepID=UPI0028691288|nr:disks large-associated protein 5-like isoform X3 [Carassius carassius]